MGGIVEYHNKRDKYYVPDQTFRINHGSLLGCWN